MKTLDNIEKKEVLSFLSKYKLMCLGTYNKFPWSAWVYYLYDESFNLYFVSNPKTKHCVNIAENPKVSIAIADSTQDPKGNKVGLQAAGIAKPISSVKELKEIINSWNKRGFVPITYKQFVKAWKSRFYRIKLTGIQIFDENQVKDLEVRFWKI